jgi:hypothetical protein
MLRLFRRSHLGMDAVAIPWPSATTLRRLGEAWRQALSAHRSYHRLRSRGTPHDTALRLALGMNDPLASDMGATTPPATARRRSRAATPHCRHARGHCVPPSRERDTVEPSLLIYGG